MFSWLSLLLDSDMLRVHGLWTGVNCLLDLVGAITRGRFWNSETESPKLSWKLYPPKYKAIRMDAFDARQFLSANLIIAAHRTNLHTAKYDHIIF